MLTLSACGRNSDDSQPTTDHVLTILARSSYERPIRQAERNLIAEWEQRPEKEGHTFRVELTTFHPQDELNHLTRLDTMLMAGQSYDIFFPITAHRNIRDYAQSGLIVDIYPLIHNCPNTDINDFFTNALEAWEIDGGLYVFPWDFSFSYAFINTALPQEIIDRFTQQNSITVAALVDMYRYLLRYYEHEFEHFSFSHGGTLHHPSKIVASYMGNFIDFDTNTANLTDENFIAFLTDFTEAFDERHLLGQERRYWTNWWTAGFALGGAYFGYFVPELRMIARGARSFTWGSGWHAYWQWDEITAVTMLPHAFMVESRHFFPAAALLHEEVFLPYFKHGIPLADDQGRLLIADRADYPAGVSISSAANGAVAWDFTRHLINAFNKREIYRPGLSPIYANFYQDSLAIPIARDLWFFRVSNSLTSAYEYYRSSRMFPSLGTSGTSPGQGWIDKHVEMMLPYIATLSEQSMALTHPPVPDFLYIDNLELFIRGLITPRDFAQRTQNAVSLWLLGG